MAALAAPPCELAAYGLHAGGLQNDWLEGVGTPALTIKNVSKEYISVCAEKDWSNTAQDRQLTVVVELCRNNTPPEQRKWL